MGNMRRYLIALRLQEKVCQQDSSGGRLNTLGLAQYRAGKYEQALNSLAQSEQLNATIIDRSEPSDIAFQAMAHQQLDHKEEAAKLLARLREIMTQEQWAGDRRGFLREAEVLIEGQSTLPSTPIKNPN